MNMLKASDIITSIINVNVTGKNLGASVPPDGCHFNFDVLSPDNISMEPKTYDTVASPCNDNNDITCAPCDASFQGPGTPWDTLETFIRNSIHSNAQNILTFAYNHQKQSPRTAKGYANIILDITVCTDTSGGANRVTGVTYERARVKPDTSLDPIALLASKIGVKPDTGLSNPAFSDSIALITGVTFFAIGHELEHYAPGQGKPYRGVFSDTVQ